MSEAKQAGLDYAREAFNACQQGRADVNQQQSVASAVILLHGIKGELLRAAEKHLAALEEEAAANIALDNAEANFSDARPEIRRAGIAMVAASTAAKELRSVIAKARESA